MLLVNFIVEIGRIFIACETSKLGTGGDMRNEVSDQASSRQHLKPVTISVIKSMACVLSIHTVCICEVSIYVCVSMSVIISI